MNKLTSQIFQLCSKYRKCKELDIGEFKKFKYPLMKFEAFQYEVEDFGYLMVLETKAMFGLMKLTTIVFTPSNGNSVPFLLIDTMSMKKKNLGYVEFYDCNDQPKEHILLEENVKKYSNVENYNEKPAWYIERRTPYSLIKGGENTSIECVEKMVLDSIEAYFNDCNINITSSQNIEKLKAFKVELKEKGNPSSGTLDRVLKDKSSYFFDNIIMKI